MYDQREKALRDHEWALSSARQEGRQEGWQEGRQEGVQEGREQGVAVGKIQLIQELLGEAVNSAAELDAMTTAELEFTLADLQARLRNRQA